MEICNLEFDIWFWLFTIDVLNKLSSAYKILCNSVLIYIDIYTSLLHEEKVKVNNFIIRGVPVDHLQALIFTRIKVILERQQMYYPENHTTYGGGGISMH